MTRRLVLATLRRGRFAFSGALPFALLALALLGCSRLTLPTGDELADLNRAYDEPQGRVDSELMSEISVSALDRLDQVLGLGRLDFVVESLTEVSEVVKEVAQSEGGSRFELTALTTVEKICPGEGGTPDPEANGRLTYTMRVRDNGVLDTVWGDFEDCRFPDPGEVFPGGSSPPREPGALVTYDGSMDVYLGGNLRLAGLEFDAFLFRLEGTLTMGALPADGGFDFRIDREKRTELRIPADEGDVVLSFSRGTTAVQLETGDGSFCCDFDDRFCVGAEGNDCDELEIGDRVLEW